MPNSAFSFATGYPILGIWYWCSDQTIVQRVLGAKTQRDAQLGPLFAGLLKIIPVFIMVLPGVLGYVLFKDIIGADSNQTLPVLINQLIPTGLKGLIAAGLLAALMSTIAAALNSSATLVAVVTNPAEKNKSALYHPLIFPKVSIVDPELMVTVPKHITASTGFDVFAHAFESYLNLNGSPYTDLMSVEAIRLVAAHLPQAVKNGEDKEARTLMAWADTMAGLSIANAGVTLPHGIGMAIGGNYPHVKHGEALAVVYPAILRYTLPGSTWKIFTSGKFI